MVERYLEMVTEDCIECEESRFLQVTLGILMELSAQHDDVLVPKAVNLWAATNFLASANDPVWTIIYKPSSNPNQPNDNDSGQVLDPGSIDYDIIRSQILAAVEQHCQKQAKVVLTELERRLLARQQTSSLLTFLVAIVILNCVERMSWLYRYYGAGTGATTESRRNSGIVLPGSASLPTTPASTASDSTYKPLNWPLQDPPMKYWEQGNSFSDLLHLLLRMRGLPPRTCVREDGTLALMSSKQYQVFIDNEGNAVVDAELSVANSWLERTGLSVRALEARYISPFDKDDRRSWDLKYIAHLLLPQP